MPFIGHAVPAHASGLLLRDGEQVGRQTAPRYDRRQDRRRHARTGPGGGRRPDWAPRYTALLVTADVASAVAAWGLGSTLAEHLDRSPGTSPAWVLAATVVWIALIMLGRGYESQRLGVGSDEMRAALRAGAHTMVLAAAVGAWRQDTSLLLVMVLFALLAPLGGLAVRLGLRRWLHQGQRRGLHLRDTVVVGSMPHVATLARQLESEPHSGMRVIGVCVPEPDVAAARAAGQTVVGHADDVAGAVSHHGAAVVAVASGETSEYLRQLAWSLEGHDAQLLVHPGLVEVAGPRMHIRPLMGLPLLAVEQPHFSGWRVSAKRLTDITLSALGLLVAGIPMLVIAAVIRLGDGGPAIFRQTRVGLNGETFTMYKFRSMRVDAEARLAELTAQNEGAGPLFKMTDDPRITRVGRLLRRTSLDELPQLINIFVGTMSVVGPRPPLPSEVAEYQRPVRRRLLVTPGLTGLWQVSGRSSLTWDESVRLDLRYVENWTMALDLLIIWRTAWAVLARRGAF